MIFSHQIIVAYVASVLKETTEEEESVPMSKIVNLANKGLEPSGKGKQLKFACLIL